MLLILTLGNRLGRFTMDGGESQEFRLRTGKKNQSSRTSLLNRNKHKLANLKMSGHQKCSSKNMLIPIEHAAIAPKERIMTKSNTLLSLN